MPAVTRPTTARHLCIILLCSVLLIMRVGGTHWHLCFDGQEPPVSIHMVDGAVEHSVSSVEGQHHDQNVDIGWASLVKHGSADFDLPLLLLTVFLLWAVIPRLAVTRARKAPARLWSDLSLLLPPLRGPPAIAIS